MPEESWMPVNHYLIRDDRRFGKPTLERHIARGDVKSGYRDSQYCILINDGNRQLLFKKPWKDRGDNGRKSPESEKKYGWKFEENLLAQYQTTLQGVVEAAKYSGITVETKKTEGKHMVKLTRELEQALRSYRKQPRPLA